MHVLHRWDNEYWGKKRKEKKRLAPRGKMKQLLIVKGIREKGDASFFSPHKKTERKSEKN